jgi:predicted CXXCH cytochrome family protein
MFRWKLIGLAATLLIVVTIPLSVVKHGYRQSTTEKRAAGVTAEFVGSETCKPCHQPEYELWKGSNHYHAMEVASEASVRGDFNDATFEHAGVVSRFYRKDGRFFVHTQGPDGRMADFEVTHTFGWNPLQQYLIPFPGGRMQCLPIAWDVKAQRWYHLYPGQVIDPKDWLYWTNAALNWNGMCAACHSTNLKKNYNIQTDTYRTTWSDINVGCEACHGPGSKHVKWAELPDMARPPVENFDLAVRTSRLRSREAVELCAPCHSRRAILGDYTHIEPDLLDTMLPSLLTPDLYFADGQILEEVYAYASFVQSKMYARDVRCSDCHNVHGTQRVKEGNGLCLQCHRAGEYDTQAHHFHKKKGETGDPIKSPEGRVLFEVGTGAECTQCHMPGRYYMGVHYRLDHSIRIPRPDLSVKLGVPDACIRCHLDKTSRWADEAVTKWYGPGRRPHYGEILQAGRSRQPGAAENLIRLAEDPLYPVIVRATALELLAGYPGEAAAGALRRALMDGEALIRRTALAHLPSGDPRRQVGLMAPLLYDPVKAVRIEAAARLAGPPSRLLGDDQRRMFERVLEEYIAAMEYSGDFVFGRFNLGNLDVELNRPQAAIENFRAAIKIDDQSHPAKVNLAMLFDRWGQKGEAEALFRQVVAAHPQLFDAAYSLGLLLAEQQKFVEAAVHLEKAAAGMPDRSRVQYNYGLLLQVLKRDREAEAALKKALSLEPQDLDFLYALADFYIKRERFSLAEQVAEKMIAAHPSHRIGHELLEAARSQSKGSK